VERLCKRITISPIAVVDEAAVTAFADDDVVLPSPKASAERPLSSAKGWAYERFVRLD
jgi:hypothetical protein